MISEYDGKTYSVNDYEQIVKNAIETKNINTVGLQYMCYN